MEDSLVNYCRICATQSKTLQNLYEIICNGVVLAEMLAQCLKRPVKKIDGLPSSICANCEANLISTYEFHNLCESSERYFRTRFFPNNEFNAVAASVNQSNEHVGVEIKVEDDSDFSTDDVGGKADEPTIVSELVCVEEHFDDDNSLVAENETELIQSTVEDIQIRRKTRHRVESTRDFECYECKKRFSQLCNLRQHMSIHDNTKKPFECTTCNMRFVHLNSWFRHRSRHTKNIHDCEYCALSFTTLSVLKQHLADQHKDQLKAYKCNQCPEEFPLQFLLVWHNEWHKKAKQFVCSTCDAVFFNERKLKAHIRDNHASHLCAECGKSFKTIHLLASHQMLHTSEKPFACELCPSRFKWKAALKTHMLVHTGQKQHVCDICGSSFTTKGSMKKHKRIHTGDRRYQCETCSMRFYSNDHLKRHKRTHTGERPYLCSYCPRSFSQSNDLTKHIRSHVGQNMYRCHCGESFRLQTELRKHSYTHYNKEEPDEPMQEEPAQ